MFILSFLKTHFINSICSAWVSNFTNNFTTEVVFGKITMYITVQSNRKLDFNYYCEPLRYIFTLFILFLCIYLLSFHFVERSLVGSQKTNIILKGFFGIDPNSQL